MGDIDIIEQAIKEDKRKAADWNNESLSRKETTKNKTTEKKNDTQD